jgi:hypothetical protein
LGYVLFLFSRSQLVSLQPLAPVQKKNGPGAEGEQRQSRLKVGHLSSRTGVKRGRALNRSRKLFRENGGRVGVLKNVVIDHEIHGTNGQRTRHKQSCSKYRKIAFGEAIEHELTSSQPPENAEPTGWFQGANNRSQCRNLDDRLTRRWSDSRIRFRRLRECQAVSSHGLSAV